MTATAMGATNRGPGRPRARATRVGALIAERRERADLTQAELGELLGVSRESVSAIEKGRTKGLDPAQINLILRHLPVTLAEILIALGVDVDAEIRSASRARANEIALREQIRRLINDRGGNGPIFCG